MRINTLCAVLQIENMNVFHGFSSPQSQLQYYFIRAFQKLLDLVATDLRNRMDVGLPMGSSLQVRPTTAGPALVSS